MQRCPTVTAAQLLQQQLLSSPGTMAKQLWLSPGAPGLQDHVQGQM